MELGLVSVIITTYKREYECVKRAIDSVLNQSYRKIEILVIDDNGESNEYSEEISKNLKEIERVKYIKNETNIGAQKSRNKGIKNSSGEFVAFLDDDDTWENKKIEKQLQCFGKNVGLVFCNGYRINENYNPPYKEIYHKNMKEKVKFEELLFEDYIGTTSQAIIRKECLNKTGLFDESLPARQDYEMWIRVSKFYDVIGVNEPLFNHFIHKGEQISKSGKKALIGYTTIYNKYKENYDKDNKAKYQILKKIAASYLKDRKIYNGIVYLVKMMIINPKLFIKEGYAKINKFN